MEDEHQRAALLGNGGGEAHRRAARHDHVLPPSTPDLLASGVSRNVSPASVYQASGPA
jgi:hypothetical protein